MGWIKAFGYLKQRFIKPINHYYDLLFFYSVCHSISPATAPRQAALTGRSAPSDKPPRHRGATLAGSNVPLASPAHQANTCNANGSEKIKNLCSTIQYGTVFRGTRRICIRVLMILPRTSGPPGSLEGMTVGSECIIWLNMLGWSGVGVGVGRWGGRATGGRSWQTVV